ncbi:MAG: Crp/Fnr family transcriptional regulator [Bacteroidia bacterium]|nr:Crp/Fnr family transcriptional regulator [Bacteroidia bacterium]
MDNSNLQQILSHQLPSLNEESLKILTFQSSLIKSRKGTKLISEGKRHNFFYTILKGGVKSYYLKDAKKVCTWFKFENEFIGTLSSFEELPSTETIELLTDSELIRFDTQGILELTKKDIYIANHFYRVLWDYTLWLENRQYQLQFMTSQERYRALVESNPELLQKVSLTDISSYLGISRETLSRIRKQH